MSNNGSTATVRLGERVFPVVPQKHARLRHHLNAEDFGKIMSGDYGHHSYRVLTILVPALETMPEHEWEGFQSQEAWDRYQAGDREAYDENNDPSPTTDDIIAAFQTALEVSGAGRLGKLLNLISRATTAAELSTARPTPLSPASPGSTGESTSTPSGTTPPTSTPSAA